MLFSSICFSWANRLNLVFLNLCSRLSTPHLHLTSSLISTPVLPSYFWHVAETTGKPLAKLQVFPPSARAPNTFSYFCLLAPVLLHSAGVLFKASVSKLQGITYCHSWYLLTMENLPTAFDLYECWFAHVFSFWISVFLFCTVCFNFVFQTQFCEFFF